MSGPERSAAWLRFVYCNEVEQDDLPTACRLAWERYWRVLNVFIDRTAMSRRHWRCKLFRRHDARVKRLHQTVCLTLVGTHERWRLTARHHVTPRDS